MKNIRDRIQTNVFIKAIVALTLLSLSLGISAAAPMTFFGEDTGLGEGTPLTSHPNADEARDNFLAHLVNPGVEDLESFSHGTSAPLSVNFGVAGTATLQGTGSVYEGATNVGRYPISGSKYWEASSDFYLEFTDPQVAFGFYGIDVGDYNGQLTITYEDGTSETLTVPHKTNTMGGTVIYFGFIDVDHPFVKVTFGNTASGTDYFGFDDFTIGTIGQVIIEDPTNIPEFPTVALPMIAIIGLALFFQRRKE